VSEREPFYEPLLALAVALVALRREAACVLVPVGVVLLFLWGAVGWAR
jgi:hypothetical protein